MRVSAYEEDLTYGCQCLAQDGRKHIEASANLSMLRHKLNEDLKALQLLLED